MDGHNVPKELTSPVGVGGKVNPRYIGLDICPDAHLVVDNNQLLLKKYIL